MKNVNSRAGSFPRVAFKLSPTGVWEVLLAEGKVQKECPSLWNIVNKVLEVRKSCGKSWISETYTEALSLTR